MYSGGGLQRQINEFFLFEITVDQAKCPRSIHNIRNRSIFDSEDEVPFGVGMVRSIQTIEQIDGIWHVKMILNEEDDEDLNQLTLYMRKELEEKNDMFTLE
ncbi:unnamed protein product [Rotaria sp. Silwood1]|nr:unnamed protein product [Rotaria sp. Silwood1]CAF4966304.1 unnamed protein product [Rotaria sp. Silwood1]CAF4968509.1 unnamed protein product [Rotaria sp. Silwood1]CAF4993019.1 unnamed protein product [Rotaria sp. Silwood1]